MTPADDDSRLTGPHRPVVLAGSLLLVLAMLLTLAVGPAAGVVVLGVAALLAGAVGLLAAGDPAAFGGLGRLGRAAGLLAVAVGGLVVAAGVVAVPATPLTAAEAAAPSVSAADPLAQPAPAAPVPPPAPALGISCPATGSTASPVFGRQVTATAPYLVTIDYGDGDHYADDDQHLGAVFSHTYPRAGTFVVRAVLTDATGRSATAVCTYGWTGRT